MIRGGPADDAAGAEVDHGGQIQPALPGVNVDDVSAPAGVDIACTAGEIPLDQIRRSTRSGIGDGGGAPPLRGPSGAAGGAQEPGNTLAGMPAPAGAQCGVQPGRSVGAVRLVVDRDDLLGQSKPN